MDAPDRVVLLNDFSATDGGAGYLAMELARGLAARDIPVTFIAGDGGRPDWPKDVEPYSLDRPPLLQGGRAGAAARGLFDRTVLRNVAGWIARHDTPGTLYHLHNWSNILSPSVFDALAPVRSRCVVHAHDFFLACPNGTFLDYPRAAVCTRRPLSIGCLATNCDKRAYPHKLWRAARHRILMSRIAPLLEDAAFVAIHDTMEPWLRRSIRPRDLAVIRNPVSAFTDRVAAPQDQTRLVHIGRIQRLKGVFDLAEAGRRIGATVDFFGTGEDLEELRARHPEHIYHGWTARAEIGRHLHSARAVVIATQSPEPFCLAAFESAACGVPLVLSDAILASPELVATGAALSFAAGDPGSLARALGRVMTDDALVRRLTGATGTAPAILAQNTDGWVAAHLRLYRSRLTRQTARPRHRAPVANPQLATTRSTQQ